MNGIKATKGMGLSPLFSATLVPISVWKRFLYTEMHNMFLNFCRVASSLLVAVLLPVPGCLARGGVYWVFILPLRIWKSQFSVRRGFFGAPCAMAGLPAANPEFKSGSFAVFYAGLVGCVGRMAWAAGFLADVPKTSI